MKTERKDYLVDQKVHEAFVAYPSDISATTRLPTVILFHAWRGKDEFVCEKAKELSKAGVQAIAVDLYGKGVLGESEKENLGLMTPFMEDRAMLRRKLTQTLDFCKSLENTDPDKVVAMGYCFGGLCALDLARSGAEILGAVSFHGLFKPALGLPRNPIKAKILAFHGHEDPMVPPSEVQSLQKELTEAGADWQIHVFGNTLHAFMNPEANDRAGGKLYSPDAERRTNWMLKEFFNETIGVSISY